MILRHQDCGKDDRLTNLFDHAGIRKIRRVINFHDLAVPALDLIDHCRSRGHQVKIILTLQTFLHDLHVQ